MYSDVIADMFTRIRNSLQENHDSVEIPYSKLKYNIIKILKENGFITSFTISNKTLSQKFIKVTLKYKKNGTSIISQIKRISKPSKRYFVQKKDIPEVLNGFGISIISTSKGLMTGRDARLNNVGGEYIGKVW